MIAESVEKRCRMVDGGWVELVNLQKARDIGIGEEREGRMYIVHEIICGIDHGIA